MKGIREELPRKKSFDQTGRKRCSKYWAFIWKVEVHPGGEHSRYRDRESGCVAHGRHNEEATMAGEQRTKEVDQRVPRS